MNCPNCDSNENRVVDTRTSRGGLAVRRRRECAGCGTRFTTYEFVEEQPIVVLKASGGSEEYDRSKLLRSVRAACAKRPLTPARIETLIGEVEDAISKSAGLEVPSSRIGEEVMNRLKPLDRVAYIRYASVYRNFQDPDEFQEFVDDLKAKLRMERLSIDQVELPLPREEE